MSDAATDTALLRQLASSDEGAVRAALETLAARATPPDAVTAAAVLGCVGAPAKALQRRAADLLARTDGDVRGAVVDRLREGSRADDARLRWGATYALGRLGVVEPAMAPPLIEALASADGDQRWAAAELLVACARHAPQAVLPLVRAALGSDQAACRKMILYVLRDLGPHPDDAAAFVAALGDGDVAVRLAALSGLARLDPAPPDALPRVLALVADDVDAGLRRAAVSALGHLGRDDTRARAALDRAARSADPALRRAAEGARRRLES